MPSTSYHGQRDEKQRWNLKYSEASGTNTWTVPDPFLLQAFSEFVAPRFPLQGSALDVAGGAGRHAIWLAKQGWNVTLIDISDTGVEQARRNAGQLESRIHFVVDDLTHFRASQSQFDLMTVFFYLERDSFPELLKALRPGGLLVYRTRTCMRQNRPEVPEIQNTCSRQENFPI